VITILKEIRPWPKSGDEMGSCGRLQPGPSVWEKDTQQEILPVDERYLEEKTASFLAQKKEFVQGLTGIDVGRKIQQWTPGSRGVRPC